MHGMCLDFNDVVPWNLLTLKVPSTHSSRDGSVCSTPGIRVSLDRYLAMVVVAVSGGTGKLGRAIVEAIVKDGGHSVKVLARNVR